MTEHAAVIFVFFFLAEYASIVLMCILTSILFLGGFLLNPIVFIDIFELFDFIFSSYEYNVIFFNNPILEGMKYAMSLGIKTCIMIFTFI